MSLDIKSLTAAIAHGPQAALLAMALEPYGAEFAHADGELLVFTVDLEPWLAQQAKVDLRLQHSFLYDVTWLSSRRGGCGVPLSWIYPCMLAVLLPDLSPKVLIEWTRDMLNCQHNQFGGKDCCRCQLRSELPALEQALAEYYRPIVAEAGMAAVEGR